MNVCMYVAPQAYGLIRLAAYAQYAPLHMSILLIHCI